MIPFYLAEGKQDVAGTEINADDLANHLNEEKAEIINDIKDNDKTRGELCCE